MKYRMYGFVPYNISDIQKGIQFGHAVVQYSLMYSNTKEYKQWANHDKTFIILSGGTTNTNPENLGNINNILAQLKNLDFKVAEFYEPDLGDQLTAVVFLVDEMIYDANKYPSEIIDLQEPEWMRKLPSKKVEYILEKREFLKNFKLA